MNHHARRKAATRDAFAAVRIAMPFLLTAIRRRIIFILAVVFVFR